ncbi:MAG: hypothetical protein R3D98_01260 [Candidatus Krumholzibacteriia bacterium]
MEPRRCDHCGEVVLDQGIRHRRRLFCGDECCEAFEDEFMRVGEPDPVDLDEEFEELDLPDDDLDPELLLDPDVELDPLGDDEL